MLTAKQFIGSNIQPAFQPLEPALQRLAIASDWPTYAELNQAFANDYQFIAPIKQPTEFLQRYEPCIHYSHQIQTRLSCWHDFFNALVWMSFPNLKKTITRCYVEAIDAIHSKQRNTLQHCLAQLDECGIVTLTASKCIADLLATHDWQQAFWHQRDLLLQSTRFVIIGHASYEKLLQPYLGLCCKNIIINVDDALIAGSIIAHNQFVDDTLSQMLNDGKVAHCRQLQPLPILGIPGWDTRNTDQAFYFNQQYFRSRPRVDTIKLEFD